MALQKDKTEAGHTPNYWKILSIEEMNIDSTSCRIILGLYKDAATRDADINNWQKRYEARLDGANFPLDITSQEGASQNTHKLVYAKLKTLAAVMMNDDENNVVDFTTGTTDV